MAVASLIMANYAPGADTPITQLPFTVPGPGTYKLTAAAVTAWNSAGQPTLSPSALSGTTVIIYVSSIDNVVINLNGQTLDNAHAASGSVGVYVSNSEFTLQNGTIENYEDNVCITNQQPTWLLGLSYRVVIF